YKPRQGRDPSGAYPHRDRDSAVSTWPPQASLSRSSNVSQQDINGPGRADGGDPAAGTQPIGGRDRAHDPIPKTPKGLAEAALRGQDRTRLRTSPRARTLPTSSRPATRIGVRAVSREKDPVEGSPNGAFDGAGCRRLPCGFALGRSEDRALLHWAVPD